MNLNCSCNTCSSKAAPFFIHLLLIVVFLSVAFFTHSHAFTTSTNSNINTSLSSRTRIQRVPVAVPERSHKTTLQHSTSQWPFQIQVTTSSQAKPLLQNDNVGITSLYQLQQQQQQQQQLQQQPVPKNVDQVDTTSIFYAGTKRGKLLQLEYSYEYKQKKHETEYFDRDFDFNIVQQTCLTSTYCIQCCEDKKVQLKPYPIYSMHGVNTHHAKNTNTNTNTNTNAKSLHQQQPLLDETNNSKDENDDDIDHIMILCGGGDRYLTIWQLPSSQSQSQQQQQTTTATTMNNNRPHPNQNRNENVSISIDVNVQQQLGPHTGWVKDVIYDNTHHLIYSIGCNCIEIWSYSNSIKQGMKERKEMEGRKDKMEWIHQQKLTVDSCTQQGCTLSSDLLCLSLVLVHYHDNHDNDHDTHDTFLVPELLLAGGVDGRIHIWKIIKEGMISSSSSSSSSSSFSTSSDTNNPQNVQFVKATSIPAHNGRLNKLLFCKHIQCLISIGNDGTVQCRDLSSLSSSSSTLDENDENSISSSSTTTSLHVYLDEDGNIKSGDDPTAKNQRNESHSELRLSSICNVHEDPNRVLVAIGTSSGIVFLVEITKQVSHHAIMLNLRLVNEQNGVLVLDDNPTIHDMICILPQPQPQAQKTTAVDKGSDEGMDYTLVIGHSKGLTSWNLNLR